jgi:phospholipid/cholesterol/gamma-HCH transport system substrate-binding protein
VRGLLAPLIKLILFAVATLTATAMLGVTIANIDLRSATEYSARFTDVTSLTEGDDVRIAGVRVGQVEKISLVDNRIAKVDFSVVSRHKLPASVTATIRYRNLVGQRYIALETTESQRSNPARQSQRPRPAAGQVLTAGAEIPLDRTAPALDLTALFNGFKPLFQALSPEDINTFSLELVRVLQGEGGTVESLLRRTGSLTRTIADKDQVIGQVVDNLNAVLDTVNARGDQLSSLVTTVQELVSGLARDREPIGAAIGSMSELATATAGLLEQSRAPLKEDIAALGLLAGNLADSERVVDSALRNMPVKMESLARTFSYGSWANLFLCEVTTYGAAPGGAPGNPAGIPITEPRCRR